MWGGKRATGDAESDERGVGGEGRAVRGESEDEDDWQAKGAAGDGNVGR